MGIIKVRFIKLCQNAVVPVYSSSQAAGADLHALAEKDIVINAGETVMVHTGIAMEIPTGYMGLIFARSGLA